MSFGIGPFPLTTTISSMPPTQVPSTVPSVLSCAPISNYTRGRARPSIAQKDMAIDIYSVFDVLNIFCACWFLNRDHLLLLVTFAQKVEAGNDVTWLEVSPQSHSHLVRQAIALAPSSYPLALVKQVMFVFILEVVNNSRASNLDKFVKTLAPQHRLPTSAPAPLLLLDTPAKGLVTPVVPSASVVGPV